MSSDTPNDQQEYEAVASDVLTLAEEQLHVAKRDVLTGRVRVSTTTDMVEEVVRQELRGVRVDVKRVSVDRTLEPGETPPQQRTEGEVTIIPILEEVLVVEKRLLLKEELHIRREATVEDVEIPVTLRKQRAVVEDLRPETDDNQNSNRD